VLTRSCNITTINRIRFNFMTAPAEFVDCLRTHRAVCSEILKLVEKENSLLRSDKPETAFELRVSRKKLLAQITESLDKVRELRVAWLKLEPAQRQGYPEVAELLRDNQNLIMKILVLDRENEHTLLRQGLVPSRHVPSANRQRPHFVANMYQRNAMR
jgi:hypothetical protein